MCLFPKNGLDLALDRALSAGKKANENEVQKVFYAQFFHVLGRQPLG